MSPKPSKTEPETDIERIEKLITEEQRRLDTETEAPKRQTAVRTVLMLYSELRKARKEERQSAGDLDQSRVIEWFLRLDTTTQGRFLRELTARSKKGSGLA